MNELDAGIILLPSLELQFLCSWCCDYGWDGQHIIKILPRYIARLCVTTGLPSVQLLKAVLLLQVAAVNNILGVLQQLWSPVHGPNPVSLDTVQTGEKNHPKTIPVFSSSWFFGIALLLAQTMGRIKIPRGNSSSLSREVLLNTTGCQSLE